MRGVSQRGRLVYDEIRDDAHKPAQVEMAVRAVQKAYNTVERVTQRASGGSFSKFTGAVSKRWNADQDKADLAACEHDLQKALQLLVHSSVHSAERAQMSRFAEMDAKYEARHQDVMNSVGQLGRQFAAARPSSAGRFGTGPALRPSYAGQFAAARPALRPSSTGPGGGRRPARRPYPSHAGSGSMHEPFTLPDDMDLLPSRLEGPASGGGRFGTGPAVPAYPVYEGEGGQSFIGQPVMAPVSYVGPTTGYAVRQFPDGTYRGQLRAGVFHGSGSWSSNEGWNYTGQWQDGEKHEGTLIYPNGDKYAGQFKDDMRHGEGSYYTHRDGSHYTGQWFRNDKHGQGSFICSSNGAKYTGQFQYHKAHGEGTVTFPGGEKYTGLFQDNVSYAEGLFTSADGFTQMGAFEIHVD
mmetsp:Transcript_68697/g.128167  ORF Transcript_68697/g.128167 Transcript_68697/m.128167 type:complete len:409 (+) Transcript_68697:145-1371(+)